QLGAATLFSIQHVTASLATGPQVTIFLSSDAPVEGANDIVQRLRKDNASDVGLVHMVRKDEALNRLRTHPAWADAFDVLPQSPLPDAIMVELSGSDFASRVDKLVADWRNWPHVEHVQLDSEWIQ